MAIRHRSNFCALASEMGGTCIRGIGTITGNDNQRRMTRAEIPLRRSPPLIAPPSRRAGFDASCENPREMALIGKAGVQGDLAQRIVGIENELLRPLHALMKQPLMRSTSDRLLESPAKMTGRQATGTGQLRETEIARQVRP